MLRVPWIPGIGPRETDVGLGRTPPPQRGGGGEDRGGQLTHPRRFGAVQDLARRLLDSVRHVALEVAEQANQLGVLARERRVGGLRAGVGAKLLQRLR